MGCPLLLTNGALGGHVAARCGLLVCMEGCMQRQADKLTVVSARRDPCVLTAAAAAACMRPTAVAASMTVAPSERLHSAACTLWLHGEQASMGASRLRIVWLAHE